MIDRHTKIILILVFAAITALFVFRARFMYELFFLIGILLTFSIPQLKLKSYLLDWLPFIILLLLYEFMRGEVDELVARVHINDLVHMEQNLFGLIPTAVMQKYLHTPGHAAWYEMVLYGFYLSHFLLPFLVAYWLWVVDRVLFKSFRDGFLTMTFLGLAIYYLYPAAPPWLASQLGFLPGVRRLIFDIPLEAGWSYDQLSLTFNLIGANHVAAMPSLHAAWPTFVSGFLILWYRRALWPLLMLPCGVWLAIVYLGEHYVIDVVAGIAVALFGLMISWYIFKHQRHENNNSHPNV